MDLAGCSLPKLGIYGVFTMRASNLSERQHDVSRPATDKSRMTVTHIAILLLFPGFFFYHTLLGVGKISAFFGGYFSEMTVVLILPMLFSYLNQIKKNPSLLSKTDLYFAMFTAYFATIVTINYFGGAHIAVIQNHLRVIAYYFVLFIAFKLADFDNALFKLLLTSSLVAMSVIIFTFSVNGTFYLAAQNLTKTSEGIATYQGFSRSYLVTLIIVLSSVKSLRWRASIYAMAAPALYVNGARSEFVAALFMFPIIEFYRSRHKLNALIPLALIFALVAFNFTYIISLLPSNRILELLDLSQSTSANARYNLNAQAVNTIFANPVLGDYASYVPGDYAHNIWAAWVDLGLFGFLYFLSLLIIPEASLLSDGFLRKTKSDGFLLVFCLLSITIFLLFTSHTFTDMTTSAALGAYANYRAGRRNG